MDRPRGINASEDFAAMVGPTPSSLLTPLMAAHRPNYFYEANHPKIF
jgi:hypothetical protein